MQQTRRRILFIVILLLGTAWTLISADKEGVSTAGKIPAPQEGFLAPDFALKTLNGEEIRLSDLRGKVVLLNFWATWCPPCRGEMPAFQEAYTDYQEKDFIILAVNATRQDNPEDVANFIAKYGLEFPVVLDPAGEVNQLYLVQSLPTSFFIDQEGLVQEMVVGGIAEAMVRSRVEKLLK